MKELPVSLNLEATAADLARLACRAMALIVKVRYILTHGKTHYNTNTHIIILIIIILNACKFLTLSRCDPFISHGFS